MVRNAPMFVTYVMPLISTTDDPNDMYLIVDGMPVKVRIVREDCSETPNTRDVDRECGDE
jgi:hypothetical protein